MNAAVASATHVSKPHKDAPPTPEVLGACVAYLGGLNYFFRVDERCPIVSRIGTVIGFVRVTIDPFIAPARANGTRDTNMFEPYAPPNEDKPEDQVYAFMDRTLEYRIALHEITELQTKRHSKLSLRYAFYRDTPQQTEPFAVVGRTALTHYSSRHIVDVTEPLVKYLTGNSLMFEVFGWP